MCDKKGIEYASEFTVAPSGSTIPDLVMTIDGKRIQFEKKGLTLELNEITFFDITARSHCKMISQKKKLDKTAELYIQSIPELRNVFRNKNGLANFAENEVMRAVLFAQAMEYYKSLDPTIGYAGDKGVVKSGRLPVYIQSQSRDLLGNIHDLILQHFTKGGDDYFVIHDRSSDTFEVYNVNTKNDILKMLTLPQFTQFRLSTYGGPSNHTLTRVGYKIKL